MKYLYTSVDFDPIRYERYMGASTLSPYITLSRITSDIATRMKTISPYPALDYTLLSSSYIAHVKVTNTFDKRKNFGNKTFWVMLREVTSDVKEIIKGKILPSCSTQTLSWNNDKPLTTNSCLQFNYGLQDLQIISLYGACDLIDTLPASSVNPSFKIEKNNEYIVFLRTNTICDDSLQSCIRLVIQGNANCLRDGGQTIRPLLALPIENGIVNESGSDINLGSGLTPAQYIAKIKQRRDEILNLTNTLKKDDDFKKSSKPKLTDQRNK